MKIRPLHRIIALTMAFLMFFTSVGFSIDMHYCNGDLKSYAVFGEAEACHVVTKPCPRHGTMVELKQSKKDCCSNKKVVVEDLDEDYTLSANVELQIAPILYLVPSQITWVDLSANHGSENIVEVPDDPLPPRDIYVLLETYLL